MIRLELLLAASCLLARVTITTGSQACTLPRDAVTVQTSRLALEGRMFTIATQSLADLNDESSRLLVLDAQCRPAWSAVVEGDLSHFDVRTLAGTPLLQFVTLQAFGDGTGYVHRLLLIRAGRLVLALPPINHTGKDGFYLGPLHRGRETGIVTWTADPIPGSEADQHPFIVRTWRWSGGKLIKLTQSETSQKYVAPDDAASRPDFIAKEIGLPFHDQTGDISSRFKDFDRVQNQVQDLAMRQSEKR